MSERIYAKDLIDEYKRDYKIYGLGVVSSRSIPDYRDGLKPVHKRIMDVMANRIKCINHYVKSAAIVGETLKHSHPHGDSAVYLSMTPMGNWFEINHPIVQSQGNFGNVQGDSPSAMRYTEAKISEYGMECIVGDMAKSKNVVDWSPTFDNKGQEPDYFPVAVPNLLINGAFGIAVGIKCEIPRHNLIEVIDATLKLMKNPNAEVVLIPDHCMPTMIFDTNFKALCNAGRGSYTARGIIDIEKDNKDRFVLIIKSIPDNTTLPTITKGIEKLIEKKSIQVHDIQEKSSQFKLDQRIILKKGADPEYARELIYKSTGMENRYTVNFEVLNNKQPIRMSYKSYLLAFLEFRKMCKFRLHCNMLQDLDTKYHEKEAFIKVLESGEIENIINMIRGLKKVDDVSLVEYLIKKCKITDLQAEYIINAGIKKLSLGYLEKYKAEAIVLKGKIDEHMALVLDEELINKEIETELKYFKKKYGKPRNSVLVDREASSNVPKGDFKIIITENNFIKKIPANFKISSIKNAPKHIIKGCNTQSIVLFDENGRVFKLPIHKIRACDVNDAGVDIRSILKNCTSNIIKVIYEPTLKELSKSLTKYYLVSVTHTGTIKKMDLEDFMQVPPSGILYAKTDGDMVKMVDIYHDSYDVVLFTKNKALRIGMNDIPHQKRNTKGMKSISAGIVDGISCCIPNHTTDIIVITNKGYVNRFVSSGLIKQNRNKPGVNVVKLGSTDSIYSIISVTDKDKSILVKTVDGVTEFDIADIKLGSTLAKGTKMVPGKNISILSVKVK